MKLERSDIKFPLWRKKVDSSLFQYSFTPIPIWVCNMWKIKNDYQDCPSKKDPRSKVTIIFDKAKYNGWITCSLHRRKNRLYRLWFAKDLQINLKDKFLMSFMRDIENRLRNINTIDIEDEIAFWEFLDIEYDHKSKLAYFTAYYTQKPIFPELFKRLLGSPMIHKIDNELRGRSGFEIYAQDWKPREQLDYEIEAENVLYFLIDTNNKLVYIGEASKLVNRLRQEHRQIKNWNHYRYNVLPTTITRGQRVILERMLIRDFSHFLKCRMKQDSLNISEYILVNAK